MEKKEVRGVGGRPRALPLVAIVGRPNVGKSTLFNRIIGSRRAIVHDLPGVTRDRLLAPAHWDGRTFDLCDTGGIDLDPAPALAGQVVRQAMRAAQEAVVTVLLVDGREGLLGPDADVAMALHRAGARGLVLAVNKVDTASGMALVADFSGLGIDPVIPVSAETGLGIPELLDVVVARLPAADRALEAAAAAAPAEIRVALIGRPNVGKSTLYNALLGDERSVVSEVPGTTRDTVDTVIERDGLRIRLLDTAGIRRPGKTDKGPEVLSVVMARKSIANADVVVPVLDATSELAHQDAAVAGLADEAGKAIVLAFTKWDLVTAPERRRRELELAVASRLKFLTYAQILTVSGEKRKGLGRLLKAIRDADRAAALQVATGRLNRFVERQLADLPLTAPGAKGARILYGTQSGIRPPTFVFFLNRRILAHFSTRRFVVNRLREEFDFAGTPVWVKFRSRESR